MPKLCYVTCTTYCVIIIVIAVVSYYCNHAQSKDILSFEHRCRLVT